MPGIAHAPAVHLAERYSIYCCAGALNRARQASSHLEFHPFDPKTHRSCSTLGKGWATKAFFSDDGSTAMEVALKMAYRLFLVRHKDYDKLLQSEGHKTKVEVITQADCYHGRPMQLFHKNPHSSCCYSFLSSRRYVGSDGYGSAINIQPSKLSSRYSIIVCELVGHKLTVPYPYDVCFDSHSTPGELQ